MRAFLLALLLSSASVHAGLLEEERQRLLDGSLAQSEGLVLEVPAWVEDGAFVPITVRLTGAQAPVELVLLRQAESDPRIARVSVSDLQPSLEFSTRIRLLESQSVEVIARDGAGRSWRTSQPVTIARSSCLTPVSDDPLHNLGQSRAWIRSQGEGVELVSLLRHPMETGRRKNASGQPLSRRLLQTIEIEADGRLLLRVAPEEGLAANPYWRVLLDPVPGTVALRWVDADGQVFQHSLAPAPSR